MEKGQVEVIITDHARARLNQAERFGFIGEAKARAARAARRVKRGRVALTGQFPMLIVDIRPHVAVVVTALQPGMRIAGCPVLEI